MNTMETAVKERPILFSAPMLKAIIEGRKSQTRRVVKPQPVFSGPDHESDRWYWPSVENPQSVWRPGEGNVMGSCCPYGKPGDRLWVRETWAGRIGGEGDLGGLYVTYKADGAKSNRLIRDYCGDVDVDYELPKSGRNGGWISPLYMPRGASRITLEITAVRVERVQSISEDDAIAEGAQCPGFPASLTNVGAFAKLWDKLNAPCGFGWKVNPWVWVISFRPVEAE